MRKRSALIIYITIILLASLAISFFVWKDINNEKISNEYLTRYQTLKSELVSHSNYVDNLDEIDFEVESVENNGKYLISTTLKNPTKKLDKLVILVVDQAEKEKETSKIYPSIGIVGNFDNSFVTQNPNNLTTHQEISFNYVNDKKSDGVYIYLEYFDGQKESKCYLSASI